MCWGVSLALRIGDLTSLAASLMTPPLSASSLPQNMKVESGSLHPSGVIQTPKAQMSLTVPGRDSESVKRTLPVVRL